MYDEDDVYMGPGYFDTPPKWRKLLEKVDKKWFPLICFGCAQMALLGLVLYVLLQS